MTKSKNIMGARDFPYLAINTWTDSMDAGKGANMESMISGHCTTLLEHVIIMGTSCFDTGFTSEIS